MRVSKEEIRRDLEVKNKVSYKVMLEVNNKIRFRVSLEVNRELKRNKRGWRSK